MKTANRTLSALHRLCQKSAPALVGFAVLIGGAVAGCALTGTPSQASSLTSPPQAFNPMTYQPRFFDLPQRAGGVTATTAPQTTSQITSTAPVRSVANALSAAAAAPTSPVDGLGPDGALCRQQTERQEKLAGVPSYLLTALSHVESGRWDDGREAKVAWPWTVMAEGRGRYFRTKAEAVAEVRKLRTKGVRNIDVGCMQINLMYHPDAFSSIEDAFDPARNVEYAVEFLTALYEETGAWTKAATRYHSATPEHAIRYSGVLAKEWTALFKSGYDERTGARPTLSLASSAPTPSTAVAPQPPAARPLYPQAQVAAVAQARQKLEARKNEQAQKQQEARAYAENWRAQKLQTYLQSRRAPLVQTAQN